MRRPLLTPILLALIAITGTPLLRAQSPVVTPESTPLPVLTYRGSLLENKQPVNGERTFEFSILDGTNHQLWDSGPQNLLVLGGLYTVALGAGTMPAIPISLTNKASLKLHIVASGQPVTPDVAILPPLQILPTWGFLDSLYGDVMGAQNLTLVSKLQGFPIDFTIPPQTGQALTFTGTSWAPSWDLGPQGPMGPQGPAGPQGPMGLTGPTGLNGPQGPTGLTGAMGSMGPQGPIGLTGTAGPQGLPGLTGMTGATGPQGPAGTNGPDGRTIVSGAGTPVLTGALGNVGDFYLDTLNNQLYGPKVGTDWTNLTGVSLVGPAGPEGVAGIPGVAGPQGPMGLSGAAGPQGPIGLAGPSGPQGPQGIGLPGATGATGPQGPAGPAGSVGPQGVQGPAGSSPMTLNSGNVVFTAGAMGLGTSSPNPDAELEVASSTQGLLIPRLALNATTSPTPLGAHVAGMMVFNTATAGDVTPGFYVDNGSQWLALTAAAGSAGNSVTFNYNGDASGTTGTIQVWTVPATVTSVVIECWGASAGISGLWGETKGGCGG